MFSPSRLIVSALLLAFLPLLPGCAHGKKAEEKSAATKTAPVPRKIGQIALVNSELGFALIDVDMGFAPLSGTALKTFPRGSEPMPDAETAILTVSQERRPPFIAVDVVRGQPQKGDAVYQ